MGITDYFKYLLKTKPEDDKHLTKVKNKLEISSTSEQTLIREELSPDNNKSMVGLLLNNPPLDMLKECQELSSPQEGVTRKDSSVTDYTAISPGDISVESLLLNPQSSSDSADSEPQLSLTANKSLGEDSSQEIPQDKKVLAESSPLQIKHKSVIANLSQVKEPAIYTIVTPEVNPIVVEHIKKQGPLALWSMEESNLPLESSNKAELPEAPSVLHKVDIWDIQEVDIFDELPTDESMAETAATSGMKELLSPSEKAIARVFTYVKECKIKPIPKAKIELSKQYFFYDDDAYLLSEENTLAIDSSLSNFTEEMALNKITKRSQIQLNNLKDTLVKILHETDDSTIKTLSPALLSKLVRKVFSAEFMLQLQEQQKKLFDKEEILYAYNTIITNIGKVIIETFVNISFLYNENTEITEVDIGKYRHVKQHERISNEAVISLLERINVWNSKTPEIKGYSTKITTKQQQQQVYAYLKLYAIEKNIIPPLDDTEMIKLRTVLQRRAQSLGIIIGEILINAKLLTKLSVDLNSTHKNIPHVKLNTSISEYFIVPLSENKPRVGKAPTNKFALITSKNNIIDIKLGLQYKKEVFNAPNTEKITPTSEKFTELMEFNNNIPLTVNVDSFKAFLSLCEKVSFLLDVDKDLLHNEVVLSAFKLIYFIDLKPIIAENITEYKDTLLDLLTFAFLFRQHQDPLLKAKLVTHASLNNLYNIVCSYKYTLNGALNDLKFYSHFSYFLIDKYPTSSGRFNTGCYFLQLQGYKLMRSLIHFAKQEQMTEEMFFDTLSILQEAIPDIKLKYKIPPIEDKRERAKYYNAYTIETQTLYLKQLKALCTCKDNEDFLQLMQSYQSILTIEEKAKWLNDNIKKPKDMWLAFSLIEAHLKGDTHAQIYQQDATSSVFQIMSILMHDVKLAELSNVKGATRKDVYGIFSTILNKDIQAIIQVNKQIIEPLLLTYTETTKEGKLFNYLLKDKEAWERIINDPKQTVAGLIGKFPNLDKAISNISLPLLNIITDDLPVKQEKDRLYVIFVRLRKYHEIMQLLNYLPPDIYNSRNICKKVIMTLGYNAGNTAHVFNIKEYLEESLLNLGKATIDYVKLEALSNVILNLLLPHITQNLSMVKKFAAIMKAYVKLNYEAGHLPIIMTSPYIQWLFIRHEIDLVSRSVLTIGSKKKKQSHSFAIFDIVGLSDQKMYMAFSPVFVQSVDAFIVQDVFYYLKLVNKRLAEMGYSQIYMATNHDCYMLDAMHSVFLLAIVQHSYNRIHLLKYNIPELAQLTKNMPPFKCTNPNFLSY